MPKDPIRRVFLTSATDADLAPVHDLARAAELRVTPWTDDLSGIATSVASRLVREASHHDALLAFVDQALLPDAAFLEIGAYLALRKPVVLLLGQRKLRPRLPSLLADLPVVVVVGEDLQATGRRLAETLDVAQRATGSTTIPKPSLSAGCDDALRAVEARDWSDNSERNAARVLTNLGAKVTPEGPGNAKAQLDLAAWVPGVPDAWNPVLVEVTGRLPSVRRRVDQLRTFLVLHGNPIGRLSLLMIDNRSGTYSRRPAIWSP